MTTNEIFGEIQKRLDDKSERVAGLSGVYLFRVSGSDPGTYCVTVADGNGVVSEGDHPRPNVTVEVASQDLGDIVGGRLDSVKALLTRKVKVAGDMNRAMGLQGLLS